MKLTLSTSHAADLLRQDDNANWSYAGALALVEYLEELEQGDEFCPVAIRCEYSEYSSLTEWAQDYFTSWKEDLDLHECDDLDEVDERIREYIQDNGQLIEFSGGIIVSSF